ncbi:hypothetical protein FOL47_003392, partial [Perkinsus chesapeaki]
MTPFAVKLHFKEEFFRTRMDASNEEPRVEEIRRLARTAWPELVHQDFRIFYVDDDGDRCPLIEESWVDLVMLGCEANNQEEDMKVDRCLKLYIKLRCEDFTRKKAADAAMLKIEADAEKLPIGVDGCTIEGGVVTVRNSSNNRAPISIVLCPCSLMKHMKNKTCDEGELCCEPTIEVCRMHTEAAPLNQGSA